MHRVWLTGGEHHKVAESIWKPHTTVAAIGERDGRFLLVKEMINSQIVYNQPAGHLDPGETLIDAVIRETLEETRYQFSPTALQGIYRFTAVESPQATYIRYLFRGEIGNRIDGELDEGIISAEWMSYEQVLDCRDQHRTPMVAQCVEDFRTTAGYPLEVISQIFA